MDNRKKRIFHFATLSTLGLTLAVGSLVMPLPHSPLAIAAQTTNNSSAIVSVINEDNYLLADGTLWAESLQGPWRSQYQFAGITAGSNNQYYGWTTNGQVMTWDKVSGKIKIVPGVNNAIQVSGEGIVLQRDGKINMIISGKPDTLPNNAKILDGFEDSYALVKNTGDVFYYSSYRNGLGRKIGSYPDAVSIKQDKTALALLRSDGSVTLIDLLTEDEPKVIAQDAASITWQGSSRTLLVAKKDGTVWSYSRSSGFAPKQLTELSGVTGLVYSGDGIYAQLNNGSWVKDFKQLVTPLSAPSISQLKLVLSKTNALVDDKIQTQVQQIYSNGYTENRPASAGELSVDQPQVVEVLSDGSLKVKALGGSNVTLTVDGMTAQSVLNGTSDQALTGAAIIEGTVYLPLQPVFKALGASVAIKGKQFQISWGSNQILLNKNSAVATVNGQQQKLKGKVQTINGQTVFPAALLSTVSAGSTISWDSKYKQAILLVNGSQITVQSAETQKLIKQAEIGSLTRLLGKSYWVNYYGGAGDRFSKVTIADITAEKDAANRTRFIVHFRGSNSTDYPSSMMTGSEITNLLSDSTEFFTYNPYNKYNWSQTTWNHIKNGEVVRGMTKQQVLLSWGEPDRKDVSKEGGYNVEVWGYTSGGSLDMIGFGNGVVYEIVSI